MGQQQAVSRTKELMYILGRGKQSFMDDMDIIQSLHHKAPRTRVNGANPNWKDSLDCAN